MVATDGSFQFNIYMMGMFRQSAAPTELSGGLLKTTDPTNFRLCLILLYGHIWVRVCMHTGKAGGM